MDIIINNLTVTNTLSLALRNEIKSGVSITPNSVSPVLKQNVTIQLESDFPYTLNRDHFTVNATSETNSTYVRYMNVIDVDDANKRLVCKFGGAPLLSASRSTPLSPSAWISLSTISL